MDLQITSHSNYLYVQVYGQVSLSDANAKFKQVLKAVVQNQSTRILVNCTELSGNLSTSDRYLHSEFAAKQIREYRQEHTFPSVRFAYVLNTEIADPRRFGEIVAHNRGIIVKTFMSEQDALQWLLKDKTNEPEVREEDRASPR